jgi:hypothetical protein
VELRELTVEPLELSPTPTFFRPVAASFRAASFSLLPAKV